jgi:Uma2 family endonuclease
MASTARTRVSQEEYLETERASQHKSEYRDGRVLAMTGASREHNLIAVNIVCELRTQLAGRPCEAYVSDMRVQVRSTGLYTYPDVVVVCGEPQFEDRHVDTLLNPTVIFEVLSPSTEAYDRGEKFAHYRRLESLTDYVLVTEERARVEHYVRLPDDQTPASVTGIFRGDDTAGGYWILSEISDPEGNLRLSSIDCDLAVRSIYERITFPVE